MARNQHSISDGRTPSSTRPSSLRSELGVRGSRHGYFLYLIGISDYYHLTLPSKRARISNSPSVPDYAARLAIHFSRADCDERTADNVYSSDVFLLEPASV